MSTEPEMFQQGLFERDAAGPYLLASRCRACGRTFYPRTGLCLDCLSSDIEERRLPRQGTLECFTTVQMPSINIAPPYSVGYVRLEDGVRVFAPIEADGRALAAGMVMRLADYRLGREPQARLAYCFVPAEP
jgi:uncharacterized OB-fold protein